MYPLCRVHSTTTLAPNFQIKYGGFLNNSTRKDHRVHCFKNNKTRGHDGKNVKSTREFLPVAFQIWNSRAKMAAKAIFTNGCRAPAGQVVCFLLGAFQTRLGSRNLWAKTHATHAMCTLYNVCRHRPRGSPGPELRKRLYMVEKAPSIPADATSNKVILAPTIVSLTRLL